MQEQRNTKRLEEGLDPLPEDAIKVVRQMRASTPPLTASELLDQQTNPSVNSAGSTSNLSISKKRSNAVSSNGTKKSEVGIKHTQTYVLDPRTPFQFLKFALPDFNQIWMPENECSLLFRFPLVHFLLVVDRFTQSNECPLFEVRPKELFQNWIQS